MQKFGVGVGSRRHAMKRKNLLCAVLIVGFMLAASFSILSATPVLKDQAVKAKIMGYPSHSPIYINGNSALIFRASVEKWNGDGSFVNPYRIVNYNIDATSSNGIQIYNTNLWVTIENITVVSTSHGYKGICLSNARNVKLQNCICSDNSYGIFISGGNNITLNDCNASSNSNNGITVLTCTNANISNCGAAFNSNHGIHVLSCLSVKIVNCYATSNTWHGMYVRWCNYSTISRAHANWDGNSGIYLSGCLWSTINGTVGGEALHNAKSGVTLADCSHTLVRSMTSSNNYGYGIRHDLSTFTTIDSCTLVSNSYGPTYP